MHLFVFIYLDLISFVLFSRSLVTDGSIFCCQYINAKRMNLVLFCFLRLLKPQFFRFFAIVLYLTYLCYTLSQSFFFYFNDVLGVRVIQFPRTWTLWFLKVIILAHFIYLFVCLSLEFLV